MNYEILQIDADVVEQIKSNTRIEIPAQAEEVIADIRSKFEEENISLSKDSLLNDEYINSNEEDRNLLLVYFYWMYNKHIKSNSDIYVSLKSIQKHLKFDQTYQDKYLRSYKFKYSIKCPNCGKKAIADFQNLKFPEVLNSICKNCNHIIDNHILSKCKCDFCQGIISKTESYLNGLQDNINELVKEEYEAIDHTDSNEIPESRLKWYADKYSSDLTKDEREIISFRPNDFNELYENFGTKFKTINKLRDRYAIIKKRRIKALEDVVMDLYSVFNIRYNYKGIQRNIYGNLSLEYVNLRHVKINTVHYDFDRYSTELVAVLDNKTMDFDFTKDGIGYLREKENYISCFNINNMDVKNCRNVSFFNHYEILNPYFFKKERIEGLPRCNKEDIKPLFRSGVEEKKYHFFKEKYPDSIIMVNVRLADLIDIKKIESYYTSEELKYLRYCILDFVFYDLEGGPIKVVELQRGNHHNNMDYIVKDKLKRSAVERIGLLYEETF